MIVLTVILGWLISHHKPSYEWFVVGLHSLTLKDFLSPLATVVGVATSIFIFYVLPKRRESTLGYKYALFSAYEYAIDLFCNDFRISDKHVDRQSVAALRDILKRSIKDNNVCLHIERSSIDFRQERISFAKFVREYVDRQTSAKAHVREFGNIVKFPEDSLYQSEVSHGQAKLDDTEISVRRLIDRFFMCLDHALHVSANNKVSALSEKMHKELNFLFSGNTTNGDIIRFTENTSGLFFPTSRKLEQCMTKSGTLDANQCKFIRILATSLDTRYEYVDRLGLDDLVKNGCHVMILLRKINGLNVAAVAREFGQDPQALKSEADRSKLFIDSLISKSIGCSGSLTVKQTPNNIGMRLKMFSSEERGDNDTLCFIVDYKFGVDTPDLPGYFYRGPMTEEPIHSVFRSFERLWEGAEDWS